MSWPPFFMERVSIQMSQVLQEQATTSSALLAFWGWWSRWSISGTCSIHFNRNTSKNCSKLREFGEDFFAEICKSQGPNHPQFTLGPKKDMKLQVLDRCGHPPDRLRPKIKLIWSWERQLYPESDWWYTKIWYRFKCTSSFCGPTLLMDPERHPRIFAELAHDPHQRCRYKNPWSLWWIVGERPFWDCWWKVGRSLCCRWWWWWWWWRWRWRRLRRRPWPSCYLLAVVLFGCWCYFTCCRLCHFHCCCCSWQCWNCSGIVIGASVFVDIAAVNMEGNQRHWRFRLEFSSERLPDSSVFSRLPQCLWVW